MRFSTPAPLPLPQLCALVLSLGLASVACDTKDAPADQPETTKSASSAPESPDADKGDDEAKAEAKPVSTTPPGLDGPEGSSGPGEGTVPDPEEAAEGSTSREPAEPEKPAQDSAPKKAATPKPAKTPSVEDAAASAEKIDARALYLAKCKSCHGADGTAQTKMAEKVPIPSFVGSKLSKSKAQTAIRDGVAGTKMKAYKDKLSTGEIDALTKYVRSL